MNRLLFVIIILFSSCGKVLNSKNYSEVFGLDLRWDQLPTVNLSNNAFYPASGVCASEFGSVTLTLSPLPQITVPCVNDRFLAVVNYSAVGLIDGNSLTLVASQVGIPVVVTAVSLIDLSGLAAPTVLTPLSGTTVLASTQTITGACFPGATVNIISGVQGAPLTTLCSIGGSYSINAVLTQPDGAKTVTANQTDTFGSTSLNGSSSFILSPFGLRVLANSSVGFTAGIAIERLSGANWSIDWGDGTVDNNLTSGMGSGDVITHTYSSDYIGRVRLENVVAADIIGMRIGSGGWAFDVSDLPSSIINFEGGSAGNNIITGVPADLPASIQSFILSGRNTLSGSIAGIPASAQEFQVRGNNTLSGVVSDLKEGLIAFRADGSNTISGDIADIPNSTESFVVGGSNTISGNLSTLKSTTRTMIINGNNTITGNLNNIGGNAIQFLGVNGSNTITGDIADIPLSVLFLSILGSNTIFGDIADFTPTVETIRIGGTGVVTGDIANLPPVLERLAISGVNSSLTGDIANLPLTLEEFAVTGLTTITGDIASLPPNLTSFRLEGSNTTFGLINNLPATLTTYFNQGNNTTTSSGSAWSSVTDGYVRFLLRGNGPRTQTEIDNILIALSTVTNWSTATSTVNLQDPSNAAPSAVGNAAIMAILSNGCQSVLVN